MKIGIDIDGTLTDVNNYMSDKAQIFAKENNINVNVDLNTHDFYSWFNGANDDLSKFLEKYFVDYLTNIKPDDNSSEIINKLKDEGHEIVIVTARATNKPELKIINFDDTYKLTKDWLDNNNYHYDKIVFGNGNKVEVQEKENIDIFIDDISHYVYELSKNIPAIVRTRKYNLNVEGENIKRANSWNEIYDLIINM